VWSPLFCKRVVAILEWFGFDFVNDELTLFSAMNWQTVVETTVTQLGYDLVDCERSARGLLRVYIDRVQSGAASEFVVVEDCEKVTRQLQHVLEVEACSYERLEVSSPGLDRPLKKVSDYQRFSGQEIEVILKAPFQGRKKYKGILRPQEQGWGLDFTEGKSKQIFCFSLEEIKEARLVPVLDFKGKRFLPVTEDTSAVPIMGDQTDGDRKQ
jgi:ribosome maturation factor RimP